MARQFFSGPIIHSDENGKLIIKDNVIIELENGKIQKIIEGAELDKFVSDTTVTLMESGQFLIPGFIDCHTHAVQFPNLGLGYHEKLLDWLEKYTFPLEKKYSDKKFATDVFNAVVRKTLNMGTTTACYFASLYESTTTILAEKASELGQRAFIGKVNMNNPRGDGYYEDFQTSLTNTRKFIQTIEDMKNPLVQPVITPRFALSCDMHLMKELGKIAKEKDLLVQTHISENKEEIEAVQATFSNHSSYASVYEEAGLLTNKTILAHGVHLTDDELSLLEKRGCAIIHCPASNTCLQSGLCDLQRLRTNKIKIGLGTDVSGGQSSGLLESMRNALQVSNHIALTKSKEYKVLNYRDVFYFATMGGAKALSIENQIGNFIPGKQFDAILVDVNVPDGPLHNFQDYTLDEQFQRFIYCGDDRNMIHVYVNGKMVK